MAKINPTMKAIDAAARLAMGGKREAQVQVSNGFLYHPDLSSCAPAPKLPSGVYEGAELIEAHGKLKHAESITVESQQDGENWKVVLVGGEERCALTWRKCADTTAETPPTSWDVDKSFHKVGKTIYGLAVGLDKHQLRYVQMFNNGVVRAASPSYIAEWWFATNSGKDDLVVSVPDLKRALLYRGGKLAGIGTSDGKVNFVFSDGAFLRTAVYDGKLYTEDDIAPLFAMTDDSPECDLSEGSQGESLLSLLQVGSDRMVTLDGSGITPLDPDKPVAVQPLPFPLAMSVFHKKRIMALVDYADKFIPAGPSVDWKNSRMAFYGTFFRAVCTTALTDEEHQNLAVG